MDWNMHAADGKPTPGHPLEDWTQTHLWRAPGTAPIRSPCGIDGGNPGGCSSSPFGPGDKTGGSCAGGGYGIGPDARNFSFPNYVTTDWTAGSIVDVAWALTANHGGGYSYRLCRRPGARA